MDTSYYYDEVISSQLEALDEKLEAVFKKYQVPFSSFADEFIYEFMGRQEYLGVNSGSIETRLADLVNSDYDITGYLPGRFGVYRGYAGGGVHSGLTNSDISQLVDFLEKNSSLGENAGPFLAELQDEFRASFWAVLKGFDAVNSELAGREPEIWETATL